MDEFINPNEDVVRRGINRDLPCKLTDEEFMRISKTRVTREAERDELEMDLALETKKRKDQIKERDDEIGKMRRELHTGFQDRTIKCNDVFRRHPDGTGWIYTVRLDTMTEVERRPASAAEMQRYLPSMGEGSGILNEARSAQAAEATQEPARAAGGDDVPSGDEDSAGAGAGDDDDASSSDADTTADATPKKRRGRSRS